MDRKMHWDAVYARKNPLEVSWYQAEPVLSLELIAATGVPLDAPLIDIGGGASVLVDRLLGRGYTDVTVLDLSARAFAYARTRLGAQAARVHWLDADVTEFVPARRYAVWHDRAVLHFLTAAADRRRYVEALNRSLMADGQVIIAAFALGGPTRCSDLDIVQYDAAKLCAELGAAFDLVEETAERHVTPGGKDQQFGYFRFVRHASGRGP
ncbi:MAG: class I SAM-dependent methyltransferase [Gammaproteobacteria bacterium]|nr:class I SAM-dependent methyltransferase [Gammaproteobacteria bacterium]